MNKFAIPWLLCLSVLFGFAGSEAAAPTANVYTPIQAVPPNAISVPSRPAVMLNMSKDHQLFYRAYNEFTDYNGDGQPDGGYIHASRYSGYFDATKCYAYSTTTRRFSPTALANATTNYCSGGQWSGNFLNWATMTRMDMVRKALYGGYRSTDGASAGGASLTVLERASLPMDAHSFAKHYNGTDIASLTPFSETEITLCNTTYDESGSWSHLTTNPPLLRAARGNFALWNAHERRQCKWSDETVWDHNGGGNGNNFATTGLAASSSYPSRVTHGLAGGINSDFEVKVEVCNAAFLGTERCRRYPDGNYKPIGLLQEYGESDRAEFGLLTGSFSYNISGGVLRKNVSSFRNEVNDASDGTFTAVNGIVGTLNKIRVFGYRYSDSTYISAVDGPCNFQLSGLTDNRCASWGNPFGEMFTEALRYFKGLGPATAYGAIGNSSTDPKGDTMGLPRPAWVDPFSRGASINTAFGVPQCRAISIINFNASVTSYDNDTQGPFTDLGASGSLNSYIDAVGAGEGVNNTPRFAGRVATLGDSSCTAKTVGTLSQVDGLCPTGPAYRGSFSLAGGAFWAHTNPIRTMAAFPLTANLYGSKKDPNFRVDSYSVALAPGLPRIEVAAPAGRAIIQPSYVLNTAAGVKRGNGALVDFRVVTQTPTSGKYLVIWEDSEQGGDYDSDASGILEWSLSGNNLTVTTDTSSALSANPQGFGYTISGTDKDGVHYHSGINGFDFTDPTNLNVRRIDGAVHPKINESGGCSDCRVIDAPSRATYTVTGNAANALEDPLFYATKWGGFDFATGGAPDTPDISAKWDTRNAAGAIVPGGDGVPDNYFLVFNPDQLEVALRRVFSAVLAISNAVPAVSSGQVLAGSYKYIAEFDQDTVSGNVKAYQLGATGVFATAPTWTLGERLQAIDPAARQVMTNNEQSGLAFNWTTINANAAYRAMLTAGTNALSAADAQDLVNYMRGDRTRESLAIPWRVRPTINLAGPVVNAAPWLQTPPAADYSSEFFEGYGTFFRANENRTVLLWTASNDGMVHGVNASTGVPVLSYVPGLLAPRLNEQSQMGMGVRAFVDGSPFSGDVWIDQPGVSDKALEWRTYLFGTLGRGGRGVYALDVSQTASLTASNAANVFKWQFSADDDPDLGYVVSDVATHRTSRQAAPIVKLNNGQSAIILGNGYQSLSGKAVLMILPADGPSASTGSWVNRFHKIVADAGTGNGLSTPTWVDLDNNGTADAVYAGDLKGNLWKFDISDAEPANWRVAYTDSVGAAPLYIARDVANNVLPITAAPETSFPLFGGVMVTFATGSSFTASEFPRIGVRQHVYGLWDRPAFAEMGAANRALPRGYASLVTRTYARQANGEVLVNAGTAIDYSNAVAANAKDGWKIALPGDSEMVLSNLTMRLGSIFMVSVRPSAPNMSCSQLPEASLFVFDPVLGTPRPVVFGTSGNQLIVGVAIGDQKIILVADGRSVFSETNDVTGLGNTTDKQVKFPKGSGRIQWREVPGLRTK